MPGPGRPEERLPVCVRMLPVGYFVESCSRSHRTAGVVVGGHSCAAEEHAGIQWAGAAAGRLADRDPIQIREHAGRARFCCSLLAVIGFSFHCLN